MSESTGGHLRKQPGALLQRPACAGAKTAQDAHPEVGQAKQDRSNTIIHTMETPGVRRHHALALLPALFLLPNPALGHAVAPLHPGLALEFEIRDQFGSAVQDVGAQGAYRAGLVSVPPVPLSHRCPCMGQGEWRLIWGIPWSSQSHSGPFPVPWPTRRTNRSPLTCREVQISLYFFQMYGRLFTSM